MAYINVPEHLNGIRGLMAFSPETAKPLNELVEILLRNDDNTLSRGERELIATYVSHLNDCFFCQNAHGAIAQHYLQCDMEFIDAIKLCIYAHFRKNEKPADHCSKCAAGRQICNTATDR
jgi:alkylhydroperoxidase family enzyme